MRTTTLLFLIAGCAAAQAPQAQQAQGSQSNASQPNASQQAPQSQPKGAVSGVVRDAGTGTPVADVTVTAYIGEKRLGASRSDPGGHFAFKDLEPGNVRIAATATSTSLATEKFVEIPSGQEVTFDLKVGGRAVISGRVVDQNDEPVAGVDIVLIARDYAYGQLRYIVTGTSGTNTDGEYKMTFAQPGRAYILMARRREDRVEAISQAPLEPKNRKPAVMPTYYPGVEAAQGAQLITLRVGEQREHTDLRVLRTASYCVETTLQASQTFQLMEHEPAMGRIGGTGFVMNPYAGKPGDDGKIRICDLHPGSYDLKVRQSEGTSTTYYGVTPLNIVDRDIAVSPVTMPQIPVHGDVVWSDDNSAPAAHVTVDVTTLEGVSFPGEQARTPLDVPGKFSYDHLMMKEYAVDLPGGLPAGVYVKNITFSGKSILYQALEPGTGSGGASLRITLGHDGGTITAAVADKDAKAIADINVAVFPAEAPNEAALAAAMVTGRTNQNGAWTSVSLAPGKYFAIATQLPVDRSPESVARLLGARSKAQQIDLAPGGSAQVNITAASVP